MTELSLRDRGRTWNNWTELNIEPLLVCVKRRQLRFSGHVHLVGDAEEDTEHPGEILFIYICHLASEYAVNPHTEPNGA